MKRPGLFNNIKRKDNYKTEKPSFRTDQIGFNSQPCHANRAVVEIKKKDLTLESVGSSTYGSDTCWCDPFPSPTSHRSGQELVMFPKNVWWCLTVGFSLSTFYTNLVYYDIYYFHRGSFQIISWIITAIHDYLSYKPVLDVTRMVGTRYMIHPFLGMTRMIS